MLTGAQLVAAMAEGGTWLGPVVAYLDPGTGSLILQGILAAIAAITLSAKLWWHRLLVLLRIRPRPAPPRETTATESPENPRDP